MNEGKITSKIERHRNLKKIVKRFAILFTMIWLVTMAWFVTGAVGFIVYHGAGGVNHYDVYGDLQSLFYHLENALDLINSIAFYIAGVAWLLLLFLSIRYARLVKEGLDKGVIETIEEGGFNAIQEVQK